MSSPPKSSSPPSPPPHQQQQLPPPSQQQPQLAAPTAAESDYRNRMALAVTATLLSSACMGFLLIVVLFFNPLKKHKCKLFLDVSELLAVELACLAALFSAAVVAVLLKLDLQFLVTGREISLKWLKAGVIVCATASWTGMVSLIFSVVTVAGSKFECDDRAAHHFMVATVVVANLVAVFYYVAMIGNVLGF